MTPSYRYLLCDLLTDRVLAELPLTGVTFGRRISRVGSLSATLTAPNVHAVKMAKLAHSYAGRSALWVYRDGRLWWGGIPWTVNVAQGARGPVSLGMQAATFDSYAHRRVLYDGLNFTGVDQTRIMEALWAAAQGDFASYLGIEAPEGGNPLSGITRDRTYQSYDHTPVGELIEQLGDVIDGPEHTIDVFVDGQGNRVRRFRTGSRLGSRQPRMIFQRSARGGGRVIEWEHSADATTGATAFQTRGETPDGNVGAEVPPLLSQRFYNLDLIERDGWPIIDMTADHTDVRERATLNSHAEAMRAELSGAVPLSGFTVEVGNTGWNPNRLGDAVRIKLTDDWHDRVDMTVRPVACEVTAPEGDQPETVKLILGDDD